MYRRVYYKDRTQHKVCKKGKKRHNVEERVLDDEVDSEWRREKQRVGIAKTKGDELTASQTERRISHQNCTQSPSSATQGRARTDSGIFCFFLLDFGSGRFRYPPLDMAMIGVPGSSVR